MVAVSGDTEKILQKKKDFKNSFTLTQFICLKRKTFKYKLLKVVFNVTYVDMSC